MKIFGLRSVTASALSLWLGVLACLLGCAKPASAAAERRASKDGVVGCPDRDGEAGDSCCQQGHNPASSEKSRHHAMSCCPAETALVQKQDVTSPALAHLCVAVLTVANFDPFGVVSATASPSPLRHSGRDILLQVHVLRV